MSIDLQNQRTGSQGPSFTVANLEPFYRGEGKPTVFDSEATEDRVRRFSIRRENGLIHLRAYGTLDGIDLVLRPEDAAGIVASLERQLDHFQDSDTYHQSVNFTYDGIPQGEVTAADYPTLAELETALGETDLGEPDSVTSLREATDRDAALKALGIDPANVQFATIGDEDDSLVPGEEEEDDNETEARVETYDVDYETLNYPEASGSDQTDAVPYLTAGTQTGIPVQEAETPSEPGIPNPVSYVSNGTLRTVPDEADEFHAGFLAGKQTARLETTNGVEHSKTLNFLNIPDPYEAGYAAGYMAETKGDFAVLALAAALQTK